MNTPQAFAPQPSTPDISYIVELKIADDGHVRDTILIVPGGTSRIIVDTLSGEVEALGERLNEVADSSNSHYKPQ